MKREIRYQASAEVVSFIHRWQNWLKDERRYSLHTLDAYSRDLSVFFDFLKDYLKRAAERQDLASLDVHGFRAFLSARAARHIDKNSLAREISTLRNFFKWLNRSKILKNEDISVIVNPRRPKILPKALDVTQIFNLLKKSEKNQDWQGLSAPPR